MSATSRLTIVLILLVLLVITRAGRPRPLSETTPGATAKVQHALRPRTPDDCPSCRQMWEASIHNTSMPLVLATDVIRGAIPKGGHVCYTG